MAEGNQADYLSREVRKYDYDRWLSALFMPAEYREDIFAVLAFNSEISRIRETVSEVLLGDIRLQWWRGALAGLKSGQDLDHPVVKALQKANSRNKVDLELLEQMIDARASDLDPAPFDTVDELVSYAEGTGGLLSAQIYALLGFTDGDGRIAVQKMGTAFALTGVIRAIPYHLRQDLLLIPRDVLAEQGLTEETVFMRDNREAFFRAVSSMLSLAETEHQKAASLTKSRPALEKSALRLNSLTALYLRRLKAAGMDPASPKVSVGKVRKIWALWRG